MKRILFLAFFLLIYQNAQAEDSGLSEAYENEIVERVRSVFEAKEIEEEVERPVCATPLFMEIRHNWDKFSAKTEAMLESYTQRPTYEFEEHTYDTPEGHFRIHYVTQGDDAVLSEGWLDTCGQVLDHVWETEIESLGYAQPPDDGWYPDTLENGGDGKYDVYLLDLSHQYLGYTAGERFVSLPSGSATSYIVLDNDYVGYLSIHTRLEWLQVTFAHEFFHAIHMGYDATEYEIENEDIKPYWMEISAVWMEEMVYDDVNDYLGYLDAFFDEPWLSLKTFRTGLDFHPYGSCVWAMFLSERFDTSIIKVIWEKCAEVPGNNVFDPPSAEGKSATDQGLEGWGADFGEVFREFTVWNYFTGARKIQGRFYEEGRFFPSVGVHPLQRHSEYPVPTTHPPRLPENLASNYAVFTPAAVDTGGLEIDFDGQDDGDWRLSVVGFIDTLSYNLIFSPDLDSLQKGKPQIHRWFEYQEIVLIPAVTTIAAGAYDYSYSAAHDSSLNEEQSVPPVITISGRLKKTAFVDEILSFSVTVSDPNYMDTLTVVKTGVGNFECPVGTSPVIGTFTWTATADDLDSTYTIVFSADDGHGGTGEASVQITVETKPHRDDIGQNFPNPFVVSEHDSTFFPFELSSSTNVEIWIFNLAGELVKKLSGEYGYGHWGVDEKDQLLFWDGKNEDGEYVGSGIYLYRVETKNITVIKKMAVIR